MTLSIVAGGWRFRRRSALFISMAKERAFVRVDLSARGRFLDSGRQVPSVRTSPSASKRKTDLPRPSALSIACWPKKNACPPWHGEDLVCRREASSSDTPSVEASRGPCFRRARQSQSHNPILSQEVVSSGAERFSFMRRNGGTCACATRPMKRCSLFVTCCNRPMEQFGLLFIEKNSNH